MFDGMDNMDNPNMQLAINCTNHFEACHINTDMITSTIINSNNNSNNNESERYHIKCVATKELDDDEMEEIFKLLKTNMKNLYLKTWGWKDSEKKKELFAPESRFLIISQSNSNSKNDSDNETESKIIAFVMFQFCWDDDDEPEYPVLYIMEIQVRDTSRGHGWGKKMMEICVEIAKYWKMYKIMLTVFKINTDAIAFYKKIHFEIDSNSPSANGYRNENYEILSKVV